MSIALILFTGVALIVAMLAPWLPDSTKTIFTSLSSLELKQILAIGFIAAAMVIFLAYFRAKFMFSTRWLLATVTYNVLIVFVKFTFSTNDYANASRSFAALLTTALLIGCLYLFAFALLYLFFDGILLSRTLHKSLITTTDGRALLAIGLFFCVTLVRVILFHLPGFSSTVAATYLGSVFSSNTVILSGLLFVMCLAAVEAYSQVRRREDLKYFFASGAVLILVFHMTWALFMFRGMQ